MAGLRTRSENEKINMLRFYEGHLYSVNLRRAFKKGIFFVCQTGLLRLTDRVPVIARRWWRGRMRSAHCSRECERILVLILCTH